MVLLWTHSVLSHVMSEYRPLPFHAVILEDSELCENLVEIKAKVDNGYLP